MDFNTFERAFELVRSNTLEEIESSKEALSFLMIEMNEEKKLISNEIRFSEKYYSINALDINERIKEIESKIPKLNEKIAVHTDYTLRGDAESRLILRVRELTRERRRLIKTKSDYQNKVRRLNQELVDLYLDIEDTRRKIIDVANAIYMIKNAMKRGIHFKDTSEAKPKEIYDFLKQLEII